MPSTDWRNAPNIFANRDGGGICRVRKVDDTFAYIESVAGELATAYSMPIAEYDEHFHETWRPATAEDFVGIEDEGYRPPTNTGDWS